MVVPEATGGAAAVPDGNLQQDGGAAGRGQDGDWLRDGGAPGAAGRMAIRCGTEVPAAAVRTGGQWVWRYGGRGHQHDVSASAHAEQKTCQK